MPRNKPTFRKGLRPGFTRKPNSILSDKLDTLIDIERTQLHGTISSVRDVHKMKVRRDKVYTFVRSYSLGTVSAPSGGTDVVGAYNFTLSSLPSPGDFTTLFDQYRFVQISVSFIPLAGVGTGSPPLITCIDVDDSTAPAAITDLYQYDSAQYTQPGTTLVRTFSPKAALAAYSGVFTSFATANTSTWLDVASPTVQYYGLKYGISNAGGATANWTALAEVILQCRHPR